MKTFKIIFLCVDPIRSGEEAPYYFREVRGKTAIERVTSQFKPFFDDKQFIFVVTSLNEKEVLSRIFPLSSIIVIEPKNAGSAISSLLGASACEEDDGILFVSVNELLRVNMSELIVYFNEKKSDAGLVTFKSLSPKYSHIDTDANSVLGFYQYKAVSDIATAGLFYFKKAKDFIELCSKMVLKEASVKGKYYVGCVINEYVLQGKKITYFEIDRKNYIPLKDKSDFISSSFLDEKVQFE